MVDIDVLIKLKRISNDLENAKTNLKNANDILDDSISFNENCFFAKKIEKISENIEIQKKYLETKIISDINGV